MRAIVIDRFGGPEQLREARMPDPRPGPGEVLIRIACTSVNPVDWKIREGMLAELFPHLFPLIPGWDAAGTVQELGAGASGFSVGDRVYAYCRKPTVHAGTYCEYVAMDAAAVAPMPSNASFSEAAAIPLTGLTAWQSLFDTAKLKKGERVLVHGGAGGVGGLAVQFAKWAGATVYATSRPSNHDYVRSLGADAVFDYAREDVAAALRTAEPLGIDAVFDTVGGDVQRAGYKVLRPGGMLVSVVSIPDPEEARLHDARTGFVFVAPNGEQLRRIAALVEQGAVRPPAISEMRLEDAAKAQELSRAGHVRGKIVLRVAFPGD